MLIRLSVRRGRESKKPEKKSQKRYVSRACGVATTQAIMMNFSVSRDLVDIDRFSYVFKVGPTKA